jgi:hypothetical protein
VDLQVGEGVEAGYTQTMVGQFKFLLQKGTDRMGSFQCLNDKTLLVA